MKKLESGLLSEEDLFLFLDFYELTSGKCNYDFNCNRPVTEEYFFRDIPEHLGSFILAAGLEQFASYVEVMNRGLGLKQRRWLESSSGQKFLDKEFLDYLCNFKFNGDIYAVPEGTPVFPNEPVVVVSGRSIDVQLFETFLLNVLNFESLIATKAARLVKAAVGRQIGTGSVVDFGARRAHGRDAAVLAARAAFIGGAAGTSLVIAGMKWGIPYTGTMPHKFVQERYTKKIGFKESELLAFRQYAQSFPEDTVLLVDTFESVVGVKNAATVGMEMQSRGKTLRGIRLDSGDMLTLSKQAEKIIGEKLPKTRILASNNLDEYEIERLLHNKAPLDGYGVGTRLVTGANYNSTSGRGGISCLNGIYKLSETTDEAGKGLPSMKFTSDKLKMTLPGKKQVWRQENARHYTGDTITLREEKRAEGKPLLVPS
jgi:nicotinate phosphoribosyltransferase